MYVYQSGLQGCLKKKKIYDHSLYSDSCNHFEYSS